MIKQSNLFWLIILWKNNDLIELLKGEKAKFNSEAEIKNLKLKLGNLDPISINKDGTSISLSIKTSGKNFLNKVDLLLTYEDEYGNSFSLEESKGILINNIPWYAKITRFFRIIF